MIKMFYTLTFRVAVKPADYEAALKPEVWPYRVAVRHYRATRRERSEGSWQGQSGRSGGHINAEGCRDQSLGRGGGQQASGGGHRGHQGQAAGGQYLPTGHPGRVGLNQQRMGHIQPGPVEMSNIFSILSALGGEMPSYN